MLSKPEGSKMSNSDIQTCYLCCERPPNAILMNCGHGGICYDCAVTSIKNNNTCVECRSTVEKIFKIDMSNNNLEVVKAVSVSKVIKTPVLV